MDARHSFPNFEEFFRFYVRQHSRAGTRALHAIGTGLGLTIATVTIARGHGRRALLGLPAAYACAWAGHWLVERNRPATFGHPVWPFLGDFRMIALWAAGRLGPYFEGDATGTEPVRAEGGKRSAAEPAGSVVN